MYFSAELFPWLATFVARVLRLLEKKGRRETRFSLAARVSPSAQMLRLRSCETSSPGISSSWLAESTPRAAPSSSRRYGRLLQALDGYEPDPPRDPQDRREAADGLDFTIHAIHRAILSSIRWIPVAAYAALAGLSVIAALLGLKAVDEANHQKATEIRRRIDLDDLTQHSPLDLAQVAALKDLRESAESVGFRDGIAKLDEKLSKAGRDSLRRLYLPPDSRRTNVVADPSANVLWVGYDDRIEALDAGSPSNAPFVQARIARSGSFLPRSRSVRRRPPAPPQGATSGSRPDSSGSDSDPRVLGVLAEVEYKQWSSKEQRPEYRDTHGQGEGGSLFSGMTRRAGRGSV